MHAYVLMTNHVHLLVTPPAAGAVSRMMQAVGRRYARFINDSIGRTGTLWEGRHKSSLVDSKRYVIACYRHIELNPVRAAMVAEPGDYPWSSYRCNGLGQSDPLVSHHDAYLRIALGAVERCVLYRELVSQTLPDEDVAAIRQYIRVGAHWVQASFRPKSSNSWSDAPGWGSRDVQLRKRYSDPCFPYRERRALRKYAG